MTVVKQDIPQAIQIIDRYMKEKVISTNVNLSVGGKSNSGFLSFVLPPSPGRSQIKTFTAALHVGRVFAPFDHTKENALPSIVTDSTDIHALHNFMTAVSVWNSKIEFKQVMDIPHDIVTREEAIKISSRPGDGIICTWPYEGREYTSETYICVKEKLSASSVMTNRSARSLLYPNPGVKINVTTSGGRSTDFFRHTSIPTASPFINVEMATGFGSDRSKPDTITLMNKLENRINHYVHASVMAYINFDIDHSGIINKMFVKMRAYIQKDARGDLKSIGYVQKAYTREDGEALMISAQYNTNMTTSDLQGTISMLKDRECTPETIYTDEDFRVTE